MEPAAPPSSRSTPGQGRRRPGPLRLRERLAAWPALRQAEREARVWSHMWKGSVISGVVGPLLFLGAMGLGLGGLVDEHRGSVAGVDYLVFVAPGIMAASAVQSAAGSSLWPILSGTKWSRAFHAAVATPLSPADVHRGYLLWIGAGLARDATIFLAVAALLGAVPSPWGLLAAPAAVLGGLAFAGPVSAFAARQDSDVPFSVIMRVVVMPMFLFSGTFFPLDQLPAGLRPLAWVAPLWHAVELCRGATTGSLGLASGAGHVAVLVAYLAVGVWWGRRTFTWALAR